MATDSLEQMEADAQKWREHVANMRRATNCGRLVFITITGMNGDDLITVQETVLRGELENLRHPQSQLGFRLGQRAHEFCNYLSRGVK